MNYLFNIIGVACGGAIGALSRYSIAIAVSRTTWPPFTATIIANILGCFCIGIAFHYFEVNQHPDWMRALIITGLLAAFTTFSTFSLESIQLIQNRDILYLSINILVSLISGLIAVQAGLWTAKHLLTQM